MELLSMLILLLFLVRLPESQFTAHAFNCTDVKVDMEAALCDMRLESYYGFAMLLKTVNLSSSEKGDWTFFMPKDEELSAYAISGADLEDFTLRHAIPKPLLFSDMARFPTGSYVPSGLPGKLLHIQNHGKSGFFVNNARVMTPNICLDSQIKCYGIDAVIIHKNRLCKTPTLSKKLPNSPKPRGASNVHFRNRP